MANCAKCGSTILEGALACTSCGTMAASPLPPPVPKRRVWPIFLAVGCAVMVPLLGIVAAIVIPNFVDAAQRAKSKRTIADLRLIGSAVDGYLAETGSVPEVSSLAELAAVLEPMYAASVPRADGWGGEIRYQCWLVQAESGCDAYRVASAGKDGFFEHDDLREYGPEETDRTDYNRDIVFGDGQFLQGPGRR